MKVVHQGDDVGLRLRAIDKEQIDLSLVRYGRRSTSG